MSVHPLNGDSPVPAPGPAGDPLRFEFSPWDFRAAASREAREAMDAYLDLLRKRGYGVGNSCYVSHLAAVHPDTLVLGERSYIAAHAYVSGELVIGADCSINAFAVIRGKIAMGDGVRIGAHTSILGFNHTFTDTSRPMFRQPVTARGITIGDDVWIGSQVVILDGVHIGSHTVIGAGAIVTKDLPEWSVAVGNPAKVVRSRVPAAEPESAKAPARKPVPSAAASSRVARGYGPGHDDVALAAAALAGRARAQLPDLLERAWDARLGCYRNRPGAAPSVRAHCDAVELADLLAGGVPAQLSPAHHVERLQSWQDPGSGLVAELDERGVVGPAPVGLEGEPVYHVLCVGYALDLLGSQCAHPIAAIDSLGTAGAVDLVAGQDWAGSAWHAGHVTDMVGTALLWDIRRGAVNQRALEAVLGWLVTRCDPRTGMWGGSVAAPGDAPMVNMVNGFYRATRGTFAQFGVPLPYPRAVIDTVLRHADGPVLAPGRENACNVLDVIHPLWLAARQEPDYRRAEIVAVAREHLGRLPARWVEGCGFAFAASGGGAGPDDLEPTLKGTEMWLATAWLAADLLGSSDALGYRPRGIHRPAPALSLTDLQ